MQIKIKKLWTVSSQGKKNYAVTFQTFSQAKRKSVQEISLKKKTSRTENVNKNKFNGLATTSLLQLSGRASEILIGRS